MKHILLFIVVVCISTISFAQTIWTEDFSTGTNYSVTLGGEGNDGTSDYFQRTDGTNIGITYENITGNFFAAQDVDDGGWTDSAAPSELTWSGIDITGESTLYFYASLASLATTKIDDNDYLVIQYRVDGGSWTNLMAFENDGTQYNTYFLRDNDFDGTGEGTQLTSSFTQFESQISVSGTTLDLHITVSVNAGGEDIAFDELILRNEQVAQAVETPVFSPESGVYSSTQSVSISTETSGATIYYTIDGSTPDESSAEYTSPISVSTTTTIKAIAYKEGMTASSVASATYSFPVIVNNLAELRALSDGEIVTVTGELILTYQQSYNGTKYLQDGTGGICVYDPSGIITTQYNVGDGILNFTGELDSYYGLKEIIPVVNSEAANSTGNVITPIEVTTADLTANWESYESKVITMINLDFGASAGSLFANGTNYDVTDVNDAAMVLKTNFYTDIADETIPQKAIVVGIALENDGTYMIAPRYFNDITEVTSTSVNTKFELLDVYPNPFSDKVVVEYKDVVSIEVVNSIGQIVKNIDGNLSDKVTISTSELSDGIYILKITDVNGVVVTQKVIKK